jgi:hypothetical protein
MTPSSEFKWGRDRKVMGLWGYVEDRSSLSDLILHLIL